MFLVIVYLDESGLVSCQTQPQELVPYFCVIQNSLVL